MYRTILLPLDPEAAHSWRAALPRAADLAAHSGAALHVLTVVTRLPEAEIEDYIPDHLRAEAIEAARVRLDALLADELPAGIEAEPHVTFGIVHDEVLALINRLGADLVVLAGQPPDPLRDFVVGGQSDRVVRRTRASVLVVRE